MGDESLFGMDVRWCSRTFPWGWELDLSQALPIPGMMRLESQTP